MVTTIRKLTGGTHPFYEYACLSTDVKPVSLVPENSLCREIDTGKKFYFSDGAWHEAPARGGSGEGGGLPDDFPAEGIANANKFLGFDNSGDYAALAAPSGAEKFVVTLTQDAQTEEWTADKTVAEIVAADAAGQVVVAKYPLDGMPVDIPLVTASTFAYELVFFAATIVTNQNILVSISINANNDSPEDLWLVEETNIEIPTAPLIVTMTAGQTEGQFVGDKTYKEAFDAMQLGIPVTMVIQGVAASRIVDAVFADNNYYLTYSSLGSGTPTLAAVDGSANEYISISAS